MFRPEDSHSTKQKTMWGISDFHNISTTMASDVTHICKILMSKLDRKPESKQQLNIQNSLHRFENIPLLFEIVEILLQLWDFIPDLFAWGDILLS